MKKTLLLISLLLVPFLAATWASAATTADIVFVVDESGSMSGEHAWIDDMVDDLEAGLTAAEITGNQYALVGFGARNPAPRTLADLGSVGAFQTATENLLLTGATEDGWAGIDYGFNSITGFRPQAALNVILITDEDRDNWATTDNYGKTLAYQDILDQFQNKKALLNAVVNANYTTSTYNTSEVLGVDADDVAYIADGSGGFNTDSSGSSFSSDFGTTQADYIDLAWATGGAFWNLNLLRAGGDTATSFTKAFIDIKVTEITQQDPSSDPIPEPATIMLFGVGLLGLAGVSRKRKLH